MLKLKGSEERQAFLTSKEKRWLTFLFLFSIPVATIDGWLKVFRKKRKTEGIPMKQLDVVRYYFKERLYDYVWKRRLKPLPDEASIKDSAKLLEVGCGTRFTYRAEGLEKYGIDILPEAIRLLKKSDSEAYAIVGDVMSLPFTNGTFDIIVSNALLHHLVGESPRKCRTNLKTALEEMKRVLRAEGFVLIRELIARNYFFSLLMFYISLFCARLGIEVNCLDIHSKVVVFFLNKRLFKEIASEAGFQARELKSKKWETEIFKLWKIKLGENIYYKLFRDTFI